VVDFDGDFFTGDKPSLHQVRLKYLVCQVFGHVIAPLVAFETPILAEMPAASIHGDSSDAGRQALHSPVASAI
jgi:hypothetical protein